MDLLVDAMCGGIVTYLRMCGHDAVYAGDRDLAADDAIVAAAHAEGRTVITRDVDLAARADRSILLTTRSVEDQLAELVAAEVELKLTDEPMRCGQCNGPLEPVEPTVETPEYVPEPGEKETWRCRSCGQYFWQGSHWDRVADTLERVRSAARARDER